MILEDLLTKPKNPTRIFVTVIVGKDAMISKPLDLMTIAYIVMTQIVRIVNVVGDGVICP